MIKVPRLAALGLCIALAGCATDKYSFIRYGQSVDPSTGQYDARRDPVLTDVLALNYASSVAAILRAKYTGARITRELSSTAQIGLAAAAGYGAAFHYSASTLAILGLGSAGIPELQRVFGAKERAQTYQDAVRLIEEAEIEYLALNQRPSPIVLTQNGVTLFQRVTASIHVVEKTLAGNLPSVEDMQKATERMSPEGAKKTAPGAPALNNIPANGAAPVQKLKPVVINEPIAPGLTQPENVRIVIKKSARDALNSLNNDEARKALIQIQPGTLPSTDPNHDYHEDIVAILMDTTTMDRAVKILRILQDAKEKQ